MANKELFDKLLDKYDIGFYSIESYNKFCQLLDDYEVENGTN